jgi:predicted glycoside hydrolase/deacetylase ChbG (UPF0249 family)
VRRLVVNADDFGFTRGVNAGIVDAHTRGILTATTLMANGPAFEDAVARAREIASLDIGIHGVLVQGPGLPDSVAGLVQALFLKRINPYEELKRQAARVLDAGLRPTHIDTHKHTHLLPPVLEALARVAEETAIGWVRRPMDLPLTRAAARVPWTQRAVGRALHLARRRFHGVLQRRGLRTTDWFAGFQLTGHLHPAALTEVIRGLPEGVTEFMCHPGYCTDELLAARTRLKESRERELEALCSPRVREALGEAGVALVSYRDL